MSDPKPVFTIFSKPWKDLPLPDLARKIKAMGFDGIELPVRPGFQVSPDQAGKKLPQAVKILADEGLKIASIAATTDASPLGASIIAACGQAGVPILRILVSVPDGASFMGILDQQIRELEKLRPLLEAHHVTIGIQNHCHRQVSSAMGLRYLVTKFDPKHVGAILDVGHCGLAGEDMDIAFDVLGSHLCLVNFKNAFWRLVSAPEDDVAKFTSYWTTGPMGMGNWAGAAAEMKKRNYRGDICLTAEYNQHDKLEELIRRDLAYAKSLMG